MFNGPVRVEWLEDGRDMRLLETLVFRDSKGLVWEAPTGSVINGASIPEIFWQIIGPPYVGKYRRASVIHDVYCTTKSRPHKAVHKVFNEMMLLDGVEERTRVRMFKAVYYFGPKWSMLNGPLQTPPVGYPKEPEDILRMLDNCPYPD